MSRFTTLEQDIQSFRNIIAVLRKYNSVGNKDPRDDFDNDSDSSDDTCSNTFLTSYGEPALKCNVYGWNSDTPPESREEAVDEFGPEDCCIFFHLAESKEPDENGYPIFQSMKCWEGVCDFSSPEFKWNPTLQIWSADSCGAEMYFEFLEPFYYHDDPNIPEREDLESQTIEQLGKHLRITEEGLNEWNNCYKP